ncbi:Bud-site selection protein [Mycena belliarum]|uniref:Bud-site selection protein n=1 Tax=Mycena belliarum TaxID=1033014 RepID=A0AAD6XQJ3_9AGAR|nr:Bud-site selection protein [Mycena belliae]
MDTAPAPRGTKRKRHEPPKEDPAVKLAGKLHHDLKDVRKAAKKARTFETQRVVKKLKGLRKKDSAAKEIAALEAELEELKTIDPDAVAHTALRSRLRKDKHLVGSPALLAAIDRELPLTLPYVGPSAGTAAPTKVQARLLSARALGAAVTEAVDDLRAAVLPKETAVNEEDVDMTEAIPATGKSARLAGVDGGSDSDPGDEGEEDGEEDEGEGDDATGWESGSIDDADGNGNDDEDDGWESGSVLSAPPPKKSAPAKPAKAASKPMSTKPAPSTSQFLPSLATGFVRGGSSDSDLDEPDARGGGERKNRRGQRARQAIWEKKYGRGANHKKKEAEEAAAMQIKAKAKGKARWTESAQVADGGWATARPASTPAPVPAPKMSAPPRAIAPKASADAGLHPSWAAKKALKAKLGNGGIVPSQGTKIVF